MDACLSLPVPVLARLYRLVGFRAHHRDIADICRPMSDKPPNALAKSMILRQNAHIMLKILRFIGKSCLFLGFLRLVIPIAGVIVGIFATLLLAVIVTVVLL